MDLWIIDKSTRKVVSMIKTYTFVQYEKVLSNSGSFEIRLPVNDESVPYLIRENYIYFDKGVVGIIKEIKDTQDSDVEITVTGYLSNHILTYRSFLVTTKYYNNVVTTSRNMVTNLFINPTDTKRKINYIVLTTDSKYIPTITSGSVTYQNTGDNLLTVLNELYLEEDLAFELYPNIQTVENQPNLKNFEFRTIKPVDRTVTNTDGNIPVVFSFDLDNLSYFYYNEDGADYCSMALVASEDSGENRVTLEVGDTTKTGIDRIELYVDARDIQSETVEGTTLTQQELEDLMRQRGLKKLEEHEVFIDVDASIIAENKMYVYEEDYFLGDYVTVQSKKLNKMVNLQITRVTKSVSNGVEHFDLGFGKDRLSFVKIDLL